MLMVKPQSIILNSHHKMIDLYNKLDWMLFQDSQQLDDQQIVECEDKKILSGTKSNVVIFKTLFLPPHFRLWIQGRIVISDQNLYNPRIYFDDQWNYIDDETYYQYQCNDSQIVIAYDIDYYVSHFSPTHQIQIVIPEYHQNKAIYIDIFFGISDFFLQIYQCPQQCDSCNENGECDKWSQMGIYFGEQNILQIEGWLKNNDPFGGIMSCGNFQSYGPFQRWDEIKHYLIIAKDHTEIRIRFKLIAVFDGDTNELQIYVNSGWQFCFTSYNFEYLNLICGNSQTIIVIDVQMPHNVPNLFISIIAVLLRSSQKFEFIFFSHFEYTKIKSIISENTNTYFGIRDFEIFTDTQKIEEKEICNDQNTQAFDGCFNFQFDCGEGCSSCVKGQCMECYSYWQYDLQNYNCIPFCGDSIIVGFEVCEDSNQIPYDGCHQCQFSCPLNCLQCKFGTCLICDPSFQLVNNICIPQCKGLLNNQNQQQIIVCLNTNHNCQPECLECQNTQCAKCLSGWILFYFEGVPNLCDFGDCQFESAPEFHLNQEVCGNGIIQDLEECDDANTIPFDGCFECKYQCEENCIDCIDGVCLLSGSEESFILDCDYGFYLIDQKCLSICGDQIVASDEKCDDDNNEPFDGCFQCQYSCSHFCQNCIEGQCMICDIGYQVKNNKCQEQCGDGLSHLMKSVMMGINFLQMDARKSVKQRIYGNVIQMVQKRAYASNLIIQLSNYNIQMSPLISNLFQ